MKNKVLFTFNVILGLMAALFAGCHSHKRVACKYGVPQDILERRMEQERLREQARLDSIAAAQRDSVKEEELPPVPDIPVCKYGPPGGNW